MNNKTFDKKKKREKEVKKKILSKRAAIRAKAKAEDEKERERREIQKVSNRIEGKTIRIRQNEGAVNQLKHNLEILEALQKEQELLEESQRNAPQLNMEGVPMAQNNAPQGLTASADVVFTPNPVSNEDVKELEEKEKLKEEKSDEQ